MKKAVIGIFVCTLLLTTVFPTVGSIKTINVSTLGELKNQYSEHNENSLKTNKGTFKAVIGVRDNEKPSVLLNGKYQSRGRFIVFGGTATNGDNEGYFRGLFRGKNFIIRLPIRDGRIIYLFGTCNFDETTTSFRGLWRVRGTRITGWIAGNLTPE